MDTCRCGHPNVAVTPHPCHWQTPLGRCSEAATQRFYNARPASLAGVQMKLVVDETWACDAHWQEFQRMLSARAGVNPTAERG